MSEIPEDVKSEDDKHIATLVEIMEGREAAAHAEQLVMDGLTDIVGRFHNGDRTSYVMRRLRIYNDAQSNRRYFAREAAAVAYALLAIRQSHPLTDKEQK